MMAISEPTSTIVAEVGLRRDRQPSEAGPLPPSSRSTGAVSYRPLGGAAKCEPARSEARRRAHADKARALFSRASSACARTARLRAGRANRAAP